MNGQINLHQRTLCNELLHKLTLIHHRLTRALSEEIKSSLTSVEELERELGKS